MSSICMSTEGRFESVEVPVAGRIENDPRSPSVVIASGGFEANLDWLRDVWGDVADNFIVRGTPYNTGVPLKRMLDAGAQSVGEARECHAIAVDARAPKFDGGIVTRLDCLPLGIVVNATRPALLRRRRGRVAQAIRHLGQADRASARTDRVSRSSMPRAPMRSCRRCSRRSWRTRSRSWPVCWRLPLAALDGDR